MRGADLVKPFRPAVQIKFRGHSESHGIEPSASFGRLRVEDQLERNVDAGDQQDVGGAEAVRSGVVEIFLPLGAEKLLPPSQTCIQVCDSDLQMMDAVQRRRGGCHPAEFPSAAGSRFGGAGVRDEAALCDSILHGSYRTVAYGRPRFLALRSPPMDPRPPDLCASRNPFSDSF